MPRRNTRTPDLPRTLYHLYNRQRNRDAMFHDDEDRRTFLDMFKRRLSRLPAKDSRGRPVQSLRASIRLVAFALMENHFHLVVYQVVRGGIAELMRPVLVGYTSYYNRKYGVSGSLFVDRTRRRPLIGRRGELDGISYVHDNHGRDCRCEFCSHRLYMGRPDDVPSWIGVSDALGRFGGVDEYESFRRLRWERKAFDGASGP
jgi:hypothetical protein